MTDLNERLARLAGWRHTPMPQVPQAWTNPAGYPHLVPNAEHSIDAQREYEAIARARGWVLEVMEQGPESFEADWYRKGDGHIKAVASTEPEARALALEMVFEVRDD